MKNTESYQTEWGTEERSYEDRDEMEKFNPKSHALEDK